MKHDLNRAVGVFADGMRHTIGASSKAPTARLVVSPKEIAETPVLGKGALGEYPPESETADYNSRIVDTWVSGIAAGNAVLERAKAKLIQASALDIPEIPARYRLDGWGNPFCVKKSGTSILLVSFGQTDSHIVSCQAEHISIPDPAHTPKGKIIRLTDGNLGLLLQAPSSKTEH